MSISIRDMIPIDKYTYTSELQFASVFIYALKTIRGAMGVGEQLNIDTSVELEDYLYKDINISNYELLGLKINAAKVKSVDKKQRKLYRVKPLDIDLIQQKVIEDATTRYKVQSDGYITYYIDNKSNIEQILVLLVSIYLNNILTSNIGGKTIIKIDAEALDIINTKISVYTYLKVFESSPLNQAIHILEISPKLKEKLSKGDIGCYTEFEEYLERLRQKCYLQKKEYSVEEKYEEAQKFKVGDIVYIYEYYKRGITTIGQIFQNFKYGVIQGVNTDSITVTELAICDKTRDTYIYETLEKQKREGSTYNLPQSLNMQANIQNPVYDRTYSLDYVGINGCIGLNEKIHLMNIEESTDITRQKIGAEWYDMGAMETIYTVLEENNIKYNREKFYKNYLLKELKAQGRTECIYRKEKSKC